MTLGEHGPVAAGVPWVAADEAEHEHRSRNAEQRAKTCYLPWCERCYAPDERDIESGELLHLHIGGEGELTLSTRCRATVELERGDFSESGLLGQAELRIALDNEPMSAEAALELAELITERAKLAITDRPQAR